MSILNIGLSGLKSTQKALEVTSNNIANTATAGFKSGSTEFAAVYNGGQRGGVDVSDIKENFSREGNLVRTGGDLDLAITGKGFFVVSDNGRLAYTQAGQFGLDNNQHIINSNGNRLQGYGIDASGNLVPGVLTDLKIEAANIAAKATEVVDFSLNLSAASDVTPLPVTPALFDPKAGAAYNYSQSTELFDSLGNSHTLTQYFNHLGGNDWAVIYYIDGSPLTAANLAATSGALNLVPDPVPAVDSNGNTVAAAAARISFGTDGQLEPLTNFAIPAPPAAPDNNVQDPYNVREMVLSFAPAGAAAMSFTIDMVKTTQFGSGFTLYKNDADGYTAGEFSGVTVADNGNVLATFTNGETKLQGQVVLANFANVNGLETGNKTVWYATSESGAALYGTPDEGNFGGLLSGAYIGSNVDISEQLVDLMAFQQNYQANAKTISTADQMMQVLFNAT